MDKVALLTASRVEPGAVLDPHWPLLSRLAPALAVTVRFRNAFGSISALLWLNVYIVTTVTLINVVWASRILALQALVATKFAAIHGIAMASKAIFAVWDAQSVRSMRKRLFHEFALFILGCGNPVLVMVFWPGWLVLGGTSFALWQFVL